MLELFCKKVTEILAKNDFSEEQQEICAYGIEIALYTLLSTSGLLMIGFLFGMLRESVLLITVYYANQTIGGGYHAKSHLICFLTMLAGLLVCIGIMKIYQTKTVLLSLSTLLATIYLLINPFHLHPNKAYLQCRSRQISYHSRFVTIISALITLLLCQRQTTIGIPAALGLIASAISRFAGKKQKC